MPPAQCFMLQHANGDIEHAKWIAVERGVESGGGWQQFAVLCVHSKVTETPVLCELLEP